MSGELERQRARIFVNSSRNLHVRARFQDVHTGRPVALRRKQTHGLQSEVCEFCQQVASAVARIWIPRGPIVPTVRSGSVRIALSLIIDERCRLNPRSLSRPYFRGTTKRRSFQDGDVGRSEHRGAPKSSVPKPHRVPLCGTFRVPLCDCFGAPLRDSFISQQASNMLLSCSRIGNGVLSTAWVLYQHMVRADQRIPPLYSSFGHLLLLPLLPLFLLPLPW